MAYVQQTRFKLILLGLLLFLLEACIGTIFSKFPFIALIGAQGGLIVAHITGKSYENSKFNLDGETNGSQKVDVKVS